MTREDIITLSRAGFTAQQIAKLANSGSKNNGMFPQVQNNGTMSQVHNGDMLSVLRQQNETLSKMVNMMQMGAINNATQPKTMSDEEMLATIINPPGWETENNMALSTPTNNAVGSFDVFGGILNEQI